MGIRKIRIFPAILTPLVNRVYRNSCFFSACTNQRAIMRLRFRVRGEFHVAAPPRHSVVQEMSSRLTRLIVLTGFAKLPCGCMFRPLPHSPLQATSVYRVSRNKYVSVMPHCLRMSLPLLAAKAEILRARHGRRNVNSLPTYMYMCDASVCVELWTFLDRIALYVYLALIILAGITFRVNNSRWIY